MIFVELTTKIIGNHFKTNPVDSPLIFKYFPNLTDTQKDQFNRLGEFYVNWNKKINIISRKDIGAFYERHVLHSLAIAKFTSFNAETKILDVGTGGGFPGIPLTILFPKVQFHLVDSIGKKIKIVKEVTKSIDLQNVTSDQARMEQIKGDYDFVVSRAVAQTKQLINWTKHLISAKSHNDLDNGWLFLKGGVLERQLRVIRYPYQMNYLSDYFTEDFFKTKQLIYVRN